MRSSPSVTEVANNFAEYIDRVTLGGEHFVLMRGRRAVAELRPVPSSMRLRDLPRLLASLPRIDPDDGAALDADLAAAGEHIAQLPERDAYGLDF